MVIAQRHVLVVRPCARWPLGPRVHSVRPVLGRGAQDDWSRFKNDKLRNIRLEPLVEMEGQGGDRATSTVAIAPHCDARSVPRVLALRITSFATFDCHPSSRWRAKTVIEFHRQTRSHCIACDAVGTSSPQPCAQTLSCPELWHSDASLDRATEDDALLRGNVPFP